MTKIYRQGDVLLKKIEALPKKVRKLDTDIIVRGEATGHAHRIVNGSIFFGLGKMFLDVHKNGMLIHEEHASIELEPGIYEVVRQREFDPAYTDSRLVVD